MASFNQSYEVDLQDATSEHVIDARPFLSGSIQTTLARSDSSNSFNSGTMAVKVSNSGTPANGVALSVPITVSAAGVTDISSAVGDHGYIHLVSNGNATDVAVVRVDVVLKSSEQPA